MAGGVKIRSLLAQVSTREVRSMLAAFPEARGYEVTVRPLRYRIRPHLAGMTEFEERRITLQVPEPFRRFHEAVQYAARRVPGKGLRFRWRSETVHFRSRRDVIRFLYCHEWYHWFLKEALGQKSSAETACDRFALGNFRRRRVGLQDALRARRRGSVSSRASRGRPARSG